MNGGDNNPVIRHKIYGKNWEVCKWIFPEFQGMLMGVNSAVNLKKSAFEKSSPNLSCQFVLDLKLPL